MGKNTIAILAMSLWIALAVTVYTQQGGDQPHEVTVTAIPDVIDADAKWQLVWQGTDNADGIIGTKDGGLLFAQEQSSTVRKLDKNDNVSVFVEDTHGTGALAIDLKGRVVAAERSEPTAIAVIYPEEQRKTIIDKFNGKSLGRINDLVVDKKDTVYFTSGSAYYVTTKKDRGKLKIARPKEETEIASLGPDLRANGIMLSPDERLLYVTNGSTILQFDIQLNGYVNNKREFAKLQGGTGDGMAIDDAGRLYVGSAPGIQVFNPQGKYLGTIPTPREAISVAFSGKEKKTLYVVGSGKTIYKIQMVAAGFHGRAK